MIRYGVAMAIGLFLTATILIAVGHGSRVANVRDEGTRAESVATDGAAALQAIDQALTGAALELSATVPADGIVPAAAFEASARRIHNASPAAQAVVHFAELADAEAARQAARGTAEGIVQLSEEGRTLYLAPALALAARDAEAGTMAVSGDSGRIPFTLAAGPEVRQALALATRLDAPVASSLFAAENGVIAPAQRTALSAETRAGFWRLVALRAAGPEGRSRSAGVLGVFVDAGRLVAVPGPGRAVLAGPVDALALPAPGAVTEDGARAVGIAAGQQGFVVELDRKRTPVSGMGWMLAVLGGLIGGLAVFYASNRENRSRVEAERNLAKHKAAFKRRSAELKRSEDRFRRLAESTNVIPWAADLAEGRFTYIGPQIERITGYPAKSWCAKGFWFDHVHPEDRQRVFADNLNNLEENDYATVEYKVRSADGRVVHMRNMLTIIGATDKQGQPKLVAQGYMLDITELKSANEAFAAARRSAEESNRSKSEFLANMSHELRTPLNGVIGFAEVMKDEVFGAIGERYKEYAENIHTSGTHLLSLINDVLDLSKIEAGKIELVEEETDVGVIVSKCRQLLHERASQAGLHIRMEMPAPLPFVVVDGRRIKQVILNLMSNAVKFTPPGGRITLRAELDKTKGVKIAVADTGIGMSKEEMEVALEQFGQIDSELSRQHEGTGLGLPIARSLVELHGGELEVDSKPQAGTTVTIWLPLKRVVARDAANDEAVKKAG